MKKILLLLPFCFLVAIGYSQTQSLDDEVTLIQAAFGKEKKMIVDAYMDLPESVSPGFWTVYQAYEKERQILSRERFKLIDRYITAYDQIGNDEADELASASLKNDVALSKLHAKYYKKFKKVTSAVDAAKFLQIDIYIHNTIRNAIQQELPFIGEF
ncbi:hypothetical protein [Algoriphagus namhaensis]